MKKDSKLTHQDHINKNFDAFIELLDGGDLDSDIGKTALMVNAEVKQIFDTWQDALTVGHMLKEQDKGLVFSIQEIKKDPVDFGNFSRAFI